MKFIDFFAGIGGFRSGLEKNGHKCVGYCEIDKYARQAYQAMYDTEGEWTGTDITQVQADELPQADIWTFGFPCQDISVAGKQKGIKQGTRSGLFYEIIRLLEEIENEEYKPKWIICENVKNLLSIDRGLGFLECLYQMDQVGYNAEWCVYNSKDYGVPQNRERVYIVGHLRGISGREILPKPRKNQSDIIQIGTIPQHRQRGSIVNSNGITSALCATDYKGAKMVYLPTPQNDVQKVLIRNKSKCGYLEAIKGDGIELSYPTSHMKKGRVKKQISPTITTSCSAGVLMNEEPVAIRRLTPREYWRLQGFTDEQFDKAKATGLSNTQLYKQAGNAVTVNVVETVTKGLS